MRFGAAIAFSGFFAVVFPAVDAYAQQGFTAFAVPTANSEPAGITIGPDGNVWFTEFQGNKVAKMTPTGTFTEYVIPTPNSGARGIVAGPDGLLWFAQQNTGKIGRVTTTGTFLPDLTPPTLNSQPISIVVGPDNNLWFVQFAGSKIAKVTTAGVFTEFPTPTPAAGPREITKGADGNLWFTELYGNKIGKITTAGAITEFPVPTANVWPVGITAGPDGALWFTEYKTNAAANRNQIGRITTAGVMTEFDSHFVGDVSLLGIITGDDGSLWFSLYTDGITEIARLLPENTSGFGTGGIEGYSPFQGFGSAREFTRDATGNIWFTTNGNATYPNANYIVRYTMPECADAWNFNLSQSELVRRGSIFNSNTAATGEANEPDHARASLPLNSVWCTWRTGTDGPVTFDTTGSSFDTTLAVYSGQFINGLTELGSNNDISTTNRQSRVTFNAVKLTTYYVAIDGAGSAVGNYVLNWSQNVDPAPPTLAAVLPSARSVLTDTTATAFATIINAGSTAATGCAPSKPPGFPALFSYQTTNAANQLIGTPNTPAAIAAGGSQNFVFSITPTRDLNAADVSLRFRCSGMNDTVTVSGLNTFLLSASTEPKPDMVAIGATLSGDGILNIPGNTGSAFFGTAAINIGAAGSIVATIDDNGSNLPVTPTICQSNPSTGACINPTTPGSSASVTVTNNQTVTFAVFVTGTGNVPFDPAHKRLFLRLRTVDGVTRGATSVAVRTQ